MDISTLNSRAKELEKTLAPKVKCYCVVGWMKDEDVGDIFMVYVDKRAHIHKSLIPKTWYGLPVAAQEILPPGIKPPDRSSPPSGPIC